MEEVEEMGGMTKAVASGMPKLRIERVLRARQAMIDRDRGDCRGEQIPSRQAKIRSTFWMSTTWQCAQMARLENIRASRDEAACDAAWTS